MTGDIIHPPTVDNEIEYMLRTFQFVLELGSAQLLRKPMTLFAGRLGHVCQPDKVTLAAKRMGDRADANDAGGIMSRFPHKNRQPNFIATMIWDAACPCGNLIM